MFFFWKFNSSELFFLFMLNQKVIYLKEEANYANYEKEEKNII